MFRIKPLPPLLIKASFIFLTLLSIAVQAFILDTDQTQTHCYPEYPCTCRSTNSMRCDHLNLTEIPPLPPTDFNRSVWNFELGFNDITGIPADAFANISSLRNLRLDYNQIAVIDDDAFSGIEDTLNVLSLRFNNLSSLTDVFLRLYHLSVLTLEGNPISVLHANHMASLGRSLRVFTFSLGQFLAWPTQFHYLMNLRNLRVSDIPFNHLPLDAFRGFENSLLILEISNSSFNRIPSALCHLVNLQSLVYEDSLESQHPVLEPCRTPLSQVSSVVVQGNNFSMFPDIFHTFPDIEMLTVRRNPNLIFVDSDVSNLSLASIRNLDVSFNGFERIPSALRSYTNILSLNISFNFIRTVENGDLNAFPKLENIFLQGNPILYIDTRAFTTSTGVLPIHHLDLDSTALGHIPEAAASLSSLGIFRIGGKPVECSCTMQYVQHWSNITVDGQCEFSSESLQSYISGDLQNCN